VQDLLLHCNNLAGKNCQKPPHIGGIVVPHIPDVAIHQNKVLMVLLAGNFFGVPVDVANSYRGLPTGWGTVKRMLTTTALSFIVLVGEL
jgi:hypothetical protein